MSNSKNNKKYLDLTRTAKALFWKYGIRRVSIKEICDEAGVSKMTFYRYFTNKTELVKEIMDNIFGESMHNYKNIMAEDVPYIEKVRKMLLLKFEKTQAISHEFVKDIFNK